MVFPTSPTDGQEYNNYKYNTTLGVWKKTQPLDENHTHDNRYFTETELTNNTKTLNVNRINFANNESSNLVNDGDLLWDLSDGLYYQRSSNAYRIYDNSYHPQAVNADTVDGEHASAFANASHTHTGGDITSIVANADKLDNEHATAFLKKSEIPIGIVWMYDGSNWTDNSTLPGWYACDGTDGTPDLRNKFVMGGSSAGATGGSNNITLSIANLPSHNHSANHSHTASSGTQSANHTHYVSGGTSGHTTDGDFDLRLQDHDGTIVSSSSGVFSDSIISANLAAMMRGTVSLNKQEIAFYDYHTHTWNDTSDNNNNNHTHPITVNTKTMNTGSTGSGTAIDNRPSYYSLIFIRKNS